MKAFAFSKNKRLKSNEQFREVIKNRARAADKLLIVYAQPNGSEMSRLGVTVGKSCGGAVARNRVKRLIREAFRLNPDRIPVGFDYVVMVNPAIKDNLESKPKKLKLKTIEESLISLINQLNQANGFS
ncbi:MAG: ribonuclease P protein component [Sedimentisphaerales bacterium]|nr:ribonuclease P protein component [Sedimentisphaerales bacterium]